MYKHLYMFLFNYSLLQNSNMSLCVLWHIHITVPIHMYKYMNFSIKCIISLFYYLQLFFLWVYFLLVNSCSNVLIRKFKKTCTWMELKVSVWAPCWTALFSRPQPPSLQQVHPVPLPKTLQLQNTSSSILPHQPSSTTLATKGVTDSACSWSRSNHWHWLEEEWLLEPQAPPASIGRRDG